MVAELAPAEAPVARTETPADEPKAPLTSFEAEMEARLAAEAAIIASGLIAKHTPKMGDTKRWTPQQWAAKRRRRKLADSSRKRQR